jgi:hypothetical protein
MSVSELKEILDEIDYPVLMEIVDCAWRRDEWTVEWNTDNNLDDLEGGDGDTYSVEIFEGNAEYDGYLVLNAHTGCGETMTYFFNLSKEVKF